MREEYFRWISFRERMDQPKRGIYKTSPKDDSPIGDLGYAISKLVGRLYESNEIDEKRIAAIEWEFFPLLERFGRKPKILHYDLANNPEFFTEILSLAFRAEGEERHELTEMEQARAERAYKLLESWRTVPGTDKDGVINPDDLRSWVRQVRESAARVGRSAIGDIIIGQVLAASPCDDEGIWPHPAVCDVIEEVGSVELERGFENAFHNSRGVITKGLKDGGEQERLLEKRSDDFSRKISDRWPRTAAMLRRIARLYQGIALREDQSVEMFEGFNLFS